LNRFGSSAPDASHVRLCTCLIDKDQLCRVETDLAIEPGFTGCLYILTLLLGGVCGLFLNVMPRRSKNNQIVDGTAEKPVRAAASPLKTSVRC